MLSFVYCGVCHKHPIPFVYLSPSLCSLKCPVIMEKHSSVCVAKTNNSYQLLCWVVQLYITAAMMTCS